MVEFIQGLIKNDLLATVVMSFIPLIELKGGIVFATGAGISVFEAFGLAYLGSTAVFFPIFFLLIPILNLLKRIRFFNKFAIKVENYFNDKARQTLEERERKQKGKPRSENFIKQLGVFIFIAIPLPMTGIWTGTAIAVFLGLKFKEAVLPAVIGNAVAGLLICALSAFCVWVGISLDLVLYVLFALALILLVVFIVKVALKKSDDVSE